MYFWGTLFSVRLMMSNKSPKNPRVKGKQPEAQGKKGRITLWSLVSIIATLLAYLVLIPRVTPALSEPADPNNPFTSSLTVTNNSVYPVKSVEAFIRPKTICPSLGPCPEKTEFPDPHRYDKDLSPDFARTQRGTHDLGTDQAFTIALNDMFDWGADPQFVDLAIIIRYEIPIIHWKREKKFPCYTRMQSNGKLYWYWG
jgi:hypothetical protein